RKTYGCETPARRAMSSVDVPCKPPIANSTRAAWTISSRRTSALFRVRVSVVTRCKLLLTHNHVKGGRRKGRANMGMVSTAVVSGGAGFLGSHLCDHLLEKGHRVICLDN